MTVHLRPDAVKALAAKRNQSLAELATDFGLDLRHLQRMLSGEISPSPRTRRKMCSVASCRFDDLFELVDEEHRAASA